MKTLYLSRGWSVQDWWYWCKEVWHTEPWLHPWPSCPDTVCAHHGHSPIGNRRRRSAAPSAWVCLAVLRRGTRPRGGRGWQSTAWPTLDGSRLSSSWNAQWHRRPPVDVRPASTPSEQSFTNLSYHADWTDFILAPFCTQPGLWAGVLRLGLVFAVNPPPPILLLRTGSKAD